MKTTQKKQFKGAMPQVSRQTKTQLQGVPKSHPIRCCYSNHTAQLQIVRIANITSNFFERVVMPYTKIFFEAHQKDHLEIHTGNLISSILSDKIPCHRLAFQEDYSR